MESFRQITKGHHYSTAAIITLLAQDQRQPGRLQRQLHRPIRHQPAAAPTPGQGGDTLRYQLKLSDSGAQLGFAWPLVDRRDAEQYRKDRDQRRKSPGGRPRSRQLLSVK
ncbi:Uu.00g129110.m01.CDS01 [Anthostomella pinea]|uniref:Uu.00g129110.m01.CDS01 n=1 Tax=Anthostomella pinea TaxID=933095 RepID=A0AAI8VII2_9PEZI|nr:Uu.00g129110.m01.CDS01 [Anthostomella pinea]